MFHNATARKKIAQILLILICGECRWNYITYEVRGRRFESDLPDFLLTGSSSER
jgi:hypothetical protein